MAERSDIAAALQRRQQNRKNLRRYLHTRSFNRLAGKKTTPGSERKYHSLAGQIIVTALTALFFLIGLFYVVF